eukprot:CAMPEP_0195522244 /NCGR_PEP_ID=MMETSP0794_2-20130614/20194_1 /TAXON_ID=515487 /ORGANISM="Stephanopyxis turris, Strain CCMP 815" /LENGTH=323 /DNA_ID=CAMNT_0040651951 /DNA_START=75 /DNA_END=1046 /DNA_ORIENTATION=+
MKPFGVFPSLLSFLCGTSLTSTSAAFVPGIGTHVILQTKRNNRGTTFYNKYKGNSLSQSKNTVLWSSSRDDNEALSSGTSTRKKRRVRRKDSNAVLEGSAKSSSNQEEEEEDEEIVASSSYVEVGINNVSGGRGQRKESNTVREGDGAKSSSSSNQEEEKEIAAISSYVEVGIKNVSGASSTNSLQDSDDDDEWEYYDDDEDDESASSSGDNNNLDALLADARRMRAESGKTNNGDDILGDFSIGDSVKNVISTIITVDFFVVCGLLLWFLAGIFCSYVIKDDTVQIAFNNRFETVVQPALGVLMIGSAAGALFKSPEDEEAS